jgi:Protein of unknown function (DUF1638)
MRFKLISCEILYREMCGAVANSPHQVDVEFLPKGLHDPGYPGIRRHLQESIDRTDPQKYDTILLGYALCGNGTAGLAARTLPLVIPRAHDCIALLMGGRERYQTYFEQNRDVFFRSTGWLERGQDLQQGTLRVVRSQTSGGQTLEALVSRYGEQEGQYLFDELNAYQRAYRQLTYIATGLEPDDRFEEQARGEARQRGWRFERIEGDLGLFERLLAGDWNEEEFLIIPPGWRVSATYGTDILDKEPS